MRSVRSMRPIELNVVSGYEVSVSTVVPTRVDVNNGSIQPLHLME